MKKIKLSFVLLGLCLSSSCANMPFTTKNRQVQSTSNTTEKVYADTSMVNVISANRLPAVTKSLRLGSVEAPVEVTAELIKYPNENVHHAYLVFVVKNQPNIAGQIAGNTASTEVSARFTEFVKKVLTNGPDAKTQTILTAAQNKFKSIENVPVEDRAEFTKTALLEVRDQLLGVQ